MNGQTVGMFPVVRFRSFWFGRSLSDVLTCNMVDASCPPTHTPLPNYTTPKSLYAIVAMPCFEFFCAYALRSVLSRSGFAMDSMMLDRLEMLASKAQRKSETAEASWSKTNKREEEVQEEDSTEESDDGSQPGLKDCTVKDVMELRNLFEETQKNSDGEGEGVDECVQVDPYGEAAQEDLSAQEDPYYLDDFPPPQANAPVRKNWCLRHRRTQMQTAATSADDVKAEQAEAKSHRESHDEETLRKQPTTPKQLAEAEEVVMATKS